MRYLNKIVFINSAHIPYAEIQVDGNVHFIGTQGVGKSTVLRALLFFYNADKMHLGISKEKKSFDEYYLPYLNSYIIYEVMQDGNYFSVLAFRSQGRACFRFLGTEYRKEHFISPQGKAHDGWDKIRDAMGSQIYKSRKIEKYEEYRDILFGNNRGLPVEFRKFAITESKQYQNIPRTIQNVFLNSKLDAEFIKQTIIMSMNEEEMHIDLNQYAYHLRSFEQEFTDIGKWFQKTKEGHIPVRLQADKVIALHREIHYIEQQNRTLCNELNFAYRVALASVPLEQQQWDTLSQEQKREQRLCSELAGKYQKEREKWQGVVSVQNENLKKAREQQERYEAQDIYALLKRVGTRPEVARHRQEQEEQLHTLTARFDDINHQYELLGKQAEGAFERFRNAKEAEINTLRQQCYEKKEALRKAYEALLKEIREQEKEKLDTLREKVTQKKENLHHLQLQKEKEKHHTFYAAERQTCENEQATLEKENSQTALQLKEWSQQIAISRRQWELDNLTCEQRFGTQQKEVEQQIVTARQKADEIDALLNNRKGSLYEWLSTHYPKWETTIGKVIDEKGILFRSNLSPRMEESATKGNASFYGIQLNLSEIEREVKSVQEYMDEQQQHLLRIQELRQQLQKINEEKEKELAGWKKKHQSAIKDYKEESVKAEYRTEQNIQKIRLLKADLIALQQKETEAKSALQAQTEQQTEIATHELLESEKELEKLNGLLDKRIKQKEKERNQKMLEEETLLSIRLAEIQQEIAVEQEQTRLRLNTINRELLQELSGKGADTRRIGTLQKEITEATKELAFIDDKQRLVIEYEKDKRDLFDRVDEFKNLKQTAEKQLETEQERFRQKEESFRKKIEALNKQMSEINTRLHQLREDLQATEAFKALEICPAQLHEGTEQKTSKRCKKVIDELTRNRYQLIETEDNFRVAVNRFTGNFSEQNTFHFRTRLTDREDFMEFASDLREFIDNDKIADFEKQSNEAYTNLVLRIGKETSDMLSKEGLIRKTIGHINDDFVARKFASVIKSIVLQIVPSGNRIMQHFVTIKEFNDENQLNMGMLSLFSQENQEETNRKAVGLLQSLVKELSTGKEKELTLSDTFELQFRIVENDNDSGWVDKLSNVGSDGTDVLVKAMVNIMLLNVFKEKASHKFNDFKLHCMMDEIGKLHPNNIKGILDFANSRNILLVNGSPTTYRASDYRYTYILNKDKQNVTTVARLIKQEAKG